MKFFIGILLQSQVCSVLGVCLKLLTGLSSLWCIPIAAILLLIFVKGFEMTKGEIGKYD
jgi:hypothetical protein